jgi:hypothetical protein
MAWSSPLPRNRKWSRLSLGRPRSRPRRTSASCLIAWYFATNNKRPRSSCYGLEDPDLLLGKVFYNYWPPCMNSNSSDYPEWIHLQCMLFILSQDLWATSLFLLLCIERPCLVLWTTPMPRNFYWEGVLYQTDCTVLPHLPTQWSMTAFKIE